MMKKMMLAAAMVFLAGGLILGSNLMGRASAQGGSSDGRVYELRTYHANDGKIESLHNRFRNHTNYLFVKHGMTLIGYWTPTDDKDGAGKTLVYLLAHDSRDAAKASWTAFGGDPAWRAAYADSIKDGRLVGKIDSVFMAATDYSPVR